MSLPPSDKPESSATGGIPKSEEPETQPKEKKKGSFKYREAEKAPADSEPSSEATHLLKRQSTRRRSDRPAVMHEKLNIWPIFSPQSI